MDEEHAERTEKRHKKHKERKSRGSKDEVRGEGERTLDHRIDSVAQLSQWTDQMDKGKPRKHKPVAESPPGENEKYLDQRINSVAQLSKWTDQMDPQQNDVKKKPRHKKDVVSHDSGGAAAGVPGENERFLDQRMNSVAQLSKWTEQMDGKGEKSKPRHQKEAITHDRIDHSEETDRTLDHRINSVAQLSKWTDQMGEAKPASGSGAPQAKSQRKKSAPEQPAAIASEAQKTLDQRASSVAQLSQWTSSMNQPDAKKAPHTSVAPIRESADSTKSRQGAASNGGGGEDYEEEFEDYEDEDFEEDPGPENKPSGTAAPQRGKGTAAAAASAAAAVAKKDEGPKMSFAQRIGAQQRNGGSPTRGDGSPSSPVAARSEKSKNKSSGGSGGGKFERVKISVGGSMFGDPRSVRINRLLDSGVMDLTTEKFTQLNIMPTSKYDLYLHILHMNPPSVKQVGVPGDQEQRDMETNTEEIMMVDQSVQFSYGDDTELYDTMQAIDEKKKALAAATTMSSSGASPRSDSKKSGGGGGRGDKKGSSGAKQQAAQPKAVPISTQTDSSADDLAADSKDASRLTSFLQRSSYLFETLLSEQEESAAALADGNEAKRSSGDSDLHRVFDKDAGEWVLLGQGKGQGANELIRTRSTLTARFSSLQPHLLMSAHPFPEGNLAEEDLRPYKGLYCVWDLALPGAPSFILEASGQPTGACCMSGAQSYVVVAGTMEGSLHLWDLREQSAIHKDRDSVDLRISRGVRKPCYSTHLSSFSSLMESEEDQHSAPVIQIESLDTGSGIGGEDASAADALMNSSSSAMSVVSQFVSIDESGAVIFWVTSQSTNDALDTDFGRSPWGRLSLVATKKLQTWFHVGDDLASFSSLGSGGAGRGLRGGYRGAERELTARSSSLMSSAHGVQQSGVVFTTVPHDPSSLLVSAAGGKVSRIGRFGEAPHPHSYERSEETDKLKLPASAVRGGGGGGDEKKNGEDGAGTGSATAAGRGGTAGITSSREVKYFSGVTAMAVRMYCGAKPPAIAISAAVVAEGAGVDADVDAAEDVAVADSKQSADSEADDIGAKGGRGKDRSKRGSTAASSSSSSSTTLSDRAGAISTKPFMLVGRADGTIDLFQLDSVSPLLSWNMCSFSDSNNSSDRSGGQSSGIVMLKWCPLRPSVFFAADATGSIYMFDLLSSLHKPVQTESLSNSSMLGKVKLSPQSLDVSRVAAGSVKFHMVLTNSGGAGAEGSSIRVRRLNKLLVKNSSAGTAGAAGALGEAGGGGPAEEERQLAVQLSHWSMRTSIHQLTAYVGGSMGRGSSAAGSATDPMDESKTAMRSAGR